MAKALQKRPNALAVLTDPDQGGAETVRRTLLASGLASSYQLWVCENLGHQQELVRRFDVAKPLPEELSRLLLTVLIAEPAPPPSPQGLPLFGLEDGHFLQHDDHPGLMTKQEVRIQLLADLQLPNRAFSGISGREREAWDWKHCACGPTCSCCRLSVAVVVLH